MVHDFMMLYTTGEHGAVKLFGPGLLSDLVQAAVLGAEQQTGRKVLAALYIEGDRSLEELENVELPLANEVCQLFMLDE